MRLLIVDDEPEAAKSLGGFLAFDPGIEVDALQDYDEALNFVRAGPPDVAIVDQHLRDPKRTGIDLALELRQVAPRTRTLLLTHDESIEVAVRAVRSGVDGVLWKRLAPQHLVAAVQTLHSGGKYLEPSIAFQVVVACDPRRRPGQGALTSTEYEVLILYAKGEGVDGIATFRECSRNTVKTHLKAIFEKLDVACREDAVEVARRLGIV